MGKGGLMGRGWDGKGAVGPGREEWEGEDGREGRRGKGRAGRAFRQIKIYDYTPGYEKKRPVLAAVVHRPWLHP